MTPAERNYVVALYQDLALYLKGELPTVGDPTPLDIIESVSAQLECLLIADRIGSEKILPPGGLPK